MIKLVVLEDEPSAMRRIKRIIKEIRPSWEIIGTADCIAEGIAILNKKDYDLILSDIQLSDGTSFEIFEKITIEKPVIFLTAYDNFAIKAFEVNSIQYLLKPIIVQKLHEAFQKFEKQQLPLATKIPELLDFETRVNRVNLLGKRGKKTVILLQDNLAIIYLSKGYSKALDFEKNQYFLDNSLDSLTKQLSEELFFRINRQHIVQKKAVKSYENHSSNRLLLHLVVAPDFDVVVSKEKTPIFKKWLLGAS